MGGNLPATHHDICAHTVCMLGCTLGSQCSTEFSLRGIHVQSPDHGIAEEMLSAVYNHRRMPHFLSNAAPDAEVHSGFLDILDSFQQDRDGTEPLADTVKELTGKPHLLSALSVISIHSEFLRHSSPEHALV